MGPLISCEPTPKRCQRSSPSQRCAWYRRGRRPGSGPSRAVGALGALEDHRWCVWHRLACRSSRCWCVACSRRPGSWTWCAGSSLSRTSRSGLVKRVAKYHQFHAVNRAVQSTIAAIGTGGWSGRRRLAHPRVWEELGDALLRHQADVATPPWRTRRSLSSPTATTWTTSSSTRCSHRPGPCPRRPVAGRDA